MLRNRNRDEIFGKTAACLLAIVAALRLIYIISNARGQITSFDYFALVIAWSLIFIAPLAVLKISFYCTMTVKKADYKIDDIEPLKKFNELLNERYRIDLQLYVMFLNNGQIKPLFQ